MGKWSLMLKAMALLPVLATRLPQILADGRVSAMEAAGLVTDLAGALGLPTDIVVGDFSDALPAQGSVPPAPDLSWD